MSTSSSSSPTGGTVQIGTIVAYFGKTAPADWLLCDGSAIPSEYTQLIALCGLTTPDLCGRVTIGSGTGEDQNGNSSTFTFGSGSGEFTNTLTAAQMPSHQHFGWGEYTTPNPWGTGSSSSAGYKGSGNYDSDNYLYGSTFAGGTMSNTISTTNGSVAGTSAGTTGAHNNTQPYLVISYIIYAGDVD